MFLEEIRLRETIKVEALFITQFSLGKALKGSGWNQIPSKDNYSQYIETLLKVRDHLRSIDRFRETELYDLEMSLFANAEKLAAEAMEKAETRDG